MKKIAVICSGWHFPKGFYEPMVNQKLPKGWKADYFCVSHRDPSFAIEEKKNDKFDESIRGNLDSRLYSKVLTVADIEALGWVYKEYPNTIGDWGNSNQWLKDNDWTKYDLFLFTHDDNLILRDTLFVDIIAEDESFKEWDILANTTGMPPGSIRGSFEFFKKKVIKKLGGQFDLSEVTLTREGHTTATNEIHELYDWNATVYPMTRFIQEQGLKVGYLAPGYRFSFYCLEGERGYISKTHGQNTEVENKSLDFLKEHNLI